MLMRRAIVGLAVLLLACKGDAQQPRSEPTAPEAPPIPLPAPLPATDLPAPLLWMADGPNGPSYLLGTMHLGVDVRRDVHAVVFERLGSSKTFVMETDVSEVDPVEMSRLAELPKGTTLDGELTEDQWTELTEILPSLPPSTMKRFRAWFVLVAITQSLLPSTLPMDTELQSTARSDGLKLEYLEDWRYQVDMLDDVIGAADLIDLVDNFEETKQELLDLAQGYKAGDAAVVARIMYDPEKYQKNPKVLDLLIVKRNREWMPKIEAYLEGGNTFIAVGAGHLVGDRGVIALLRERGYNVERVPVPPAQLLR